MTHRELVFWGVYGQHRPTSEPRSTWLTWWFYQRIKRTSCGVDTELPGFGCCPRAEKMPEKHLFWRCFNPFQSRRAHSNSQTGTKQLTIWQGLALILVRGCAKVPAPDGGVAFVREAREGFFRADRRNTPGVWWGEFTAMESR